MCQVKLSQTICFHFISKYQSGSHGMREAPLAVPRDDNNTEENDVAIIPELQKALLTAEKNCAAGSCSLPATQHLQIRVCINIIGTRVIQMLVIVNNH